MKVAPGKGESLQDLMEHFHKTQSGKDSAVEAEVIPEEEPPIEEPAAPPAPKLPASISNSVAPKKPVKPAKEKVMSDLKTLFGFEAKIKTLEVPTNYKGVDKTYFVTVKELDAGDYLHPHLDFLSDDDMKAAETGSYKLMFVKFYKYFLHALIRIESDKGEVVTRDMVTKVPEEDPDYFKTLEKEFYKAIPFEILAVMIRAYSDYYVELKDTQKKS